MPKYRFSGNYCFPPDRGDNKGHLQPMHHNFEAEDDSVATQYVFDFQKDRVEIKDQRLIRIDVEEKVSNIKIV